MPKVLHIGPCDSPGGMANVMRILAEHPPEGWEAELLSSHVVGSAWAKWRAYRKARRALIGMLNDPSRRPDIVHLHTAADWSWWRKRRFAQMSHKAGVPNIVHIHSGQFDTWLEGSTRRLTRFNKDAFKYESKLVVLSESWKKNLSASIKVDYVANNPLDPLLEQHPSSKRNPNKLLFLARNDPIKGGPFAQKLAEDLRHDHPNIFLAMSGIEQNSSSTIKALGWMSEQEKRNQLSSALALLVPSKFEGQPMVVLEALAMGTPVVVSDRIHSLPSEVPQAKFEDLEHWKKVLEPIIAAEGEYISKIDVRAFFLSTIQHQWRSIYTESVHSG